MTEDQRSGRQVPAPAPAARRSNAERSRQTRERVLGAALACLMADGYARTTTLAVQQRAGVSRGALLHQYPSKASLLVDAVRHLAVQQGDALERRAAATPIGSDADWLDLLWESFASPLFGAVLELWVAARSDHELHGALLPYEREIGHRLRDIARVGLGRPAPPQFDLVLAMSLAYFRGVALTAVLDADTESQARLLRGWRKAVQVLLSPDASTGRTAFDVPTTSGRLPSASICVPGERQDAGCSHDHG